MMMNEPEVLCGPYYNSCQRIFETFHFEIKTKEQICNKINIKEIKQLVHKQNKSRFVNFYYD